MKSVPKPAYLDISFPTEAQLARRSPDDFYLSVSVGWRRAKNFPPPLGMLDGMPRLPDGDEFEVLRRIDGSYTLIPKSWRDPGLRFGKGRPTLYELERAGKDMGWGKRLRSVSNLIEQYQPGFDYTASEESAYYLLETLKRYNKVLKAAESLRNFLEYTQPGKHKPTPWLKNPERDVRAAIMSDVMGMTSLQIKEQLGIKRVWKTPQGPSTIDDERKDRTTGIVIKRGRELLEHFFGADEWHKKVERMRKKRAEWLELEDKDQIYYLLAERRGTSITEERLAGRQDGFDQLLEEWLVAPEQDDQSTADEIWARDPRFQEALDQF